MHLSISCWQFVHSRLNCYHEVQVSFAENEVMVVCHD